MTYKAEGIQVWKEPVEKKHADGSVTVSLGFPVLQINDNLLWSPEKIAEAVAAAMNAYPPLSS